MKFARCTSWPRIKVRLVNKCASVSERERERERERGEGELESLKKVKLFSINDGSR